MVAFTTQKQREGRSLPAAVCAFHDNLGVNAALPDGEGHAIDGEHISRDAIVHVVGLGIAHHVIKAVTKQRLSWTPTASNNCLSSTGKCASLAFSPKVI